MRLPSAVGLALGAAVGLLPASRAAALPEWADKVTLSGTLTSDLRFDVEDYRGPVARQGYSFSVNRNDLTVHAEVAPVEKVVGVVDARLRYYGFNQAATLAQTSDRDKLDPFSVQLDQAFVAVKGVPLEALDLKVGRMVQSWGAADMFNPTDNLNARDFYDPMDYARKVPNEMIQADLYPTDWLTLTGVVVPVFKPSQLPVSTPLAFAVEKDAQGCLTQAPAPPLSHEDGQKLANLFASIDPCALNFRDPQVRLVMPQNRFADAQAALRAKLQLGDLDLALSYYYGRFSFPVAYTAVANTAVSSTQPGKVDVDYVAEVMYPRMQVGGLDFSYSAPWFFNVGIVGELAVIFPEEVDFALRAYQSGAKLAEYTYVNVPSTPFVKATLGLDYTFTKWLYVNAMYVHGFFDEFNDAYGLHDYVVAAAELKALNDALVLRLSGVLDATDSSNVANPQLTWVVTPSVELVGGAFLFGGSTHPRDPIDYASRSKFGQKAAGRSFAYLKARLTW